MIARRFTKPHLDNIFGKVKGLWSFEKPSPSCYKLCAWGNFLPSIIPFDELKN
jgi:hypothetical protein